jgi:acyl-CoA synthetase (AMP-forming)/AMP-acid ligase II
MHLATLWESIADAVSEAPALIHGRDVRSWQEFDGRAARLAGALRSAGVMAGSKVAVDLFNSNEYLEVTFAALKIRAVPCNVNYRYLDDELYQLLDDSDAEVLVFHASLGDRVLRVGRRLPNLQFLIQVDDAARGTPDGAVDYEEAMAGCAPVARMERSDEDTYISYTGGTTGLPKGVEYVLGRSTKSCLDYRPQVLGIPEGWDVKPVEAARRLYERREQPVAIPASPLMHSTGLIYASFPTLCAGGAVVTLESRSFDPHELFETVERTRATMIAIVGDAFARPMLGALEKRAAEGRPYDTSSIRSIASAGVAWSAAVKDGLLEYIPQATLIDSCGSTEGVSMGSSMVRKGDPTATAEFKAAPGAILLDSGGKPIEAGSGQAGLVACPVPTSGYYKDPVKTAAVFREIGGVLHAVPGDYAIIDANGTLTLLGRGSSCINTGGEKVFPEEVENVIKSLPGIEDCIVFGVRDDRFGERVVAIVQCAKGARLCSDDVVQGARDRLAHYKAPKEVVVVAQVPRFPNGKPDYPSARGLLSEPEVR